MRQKPLKEQTIVITGATSGIGLCTARMAAKGGAKVVLVARTEKDLRQLEEEINSAGGEALAVVADVANRDAVHRVVEAAIARFGRFDSWVNNAGVSMYGPVLDASDEDNRKLFETDFWGVVNGSREAVAHFRTHRGTLINMGSLVSDRAIPLQGMYSAAKQAVKGFTDSLRMELEQENAPVWVTLIKPASIDTPFPQHAKNNLEQEPTLPAPVYPPDEVARAILFAAVHPIRDLPVGSMSRIIATMGKHAPRMTDYYMERTMIGQQQRAEPAEHHRGALHDPGGGLSERGGHAMMARPSVYTRAAMHPWIAGVVVGAASAAVVGLLARPEQPD